MIWPSRITRIDCSVGLASMLRFSKYENSRVAVSRVFLIGVVLIFLVIAVPSSPIPRARGVAPTSLSIQPSSQPLATAGSIVTYKVNVTNITPIAGIDIYVRTDPTILNPTAIIPGTFIPGTTEQTHCVNNVGTACDVHDGAGVVHEAYFSQTGGSAVGNGTLFTITYTAVAGPGASVFYLGLSGNPETVTSNNGLNTLFDSSGFNITGVPEISGAYGAFPTSTSVSCSPSSVVVGGPTQCTATVTDTSSKPTVPGGTVSFTSDSSGNFVGSPCALVGFGGSSSCRATYTPSSLGTGAHTITANYGGDASHAASSGQFTVSVSQPGTKASTSVNCSPASVNVNSPTVCTANVTSMSPPGPAPTGTVSFSSNSTGGFTGSPCTLSPGVASSASCQVTYTPSAFGSDFHNITGTYPGDPNYSNSKGSVLVGVKDFNITASFAAAVDIGGSSVSTLTLKAKGGFTGTVNLSDPTIPNGLLCTAISPSSVTVPGSATLSCSSTTAGKYSVVVTGAIGSLSHSASANFSFVDFSLTAFHATADIGFEANSTISVAAVNGFSGTVTFSDSGRPSGLNCGAYNPASVSGSGSSVLSCSSSTTGNYTVTVTGSDGTLSYATKANFSFVDFSISSANSPPSVSIGFSAISSITVAGVNHFSGKVVFSTTALPSGLTCNFNPGFVSGSGSATLSCVSLTPGSYPVTVSGSDGVLVRGGIALTFSFVAPTLGTVSVTPSPGPVTVGQKVTVALDVTNNAATAETFTVRAKWGAITVANTTVTLGPGEKKTVSLSWDTSNYDSGTDNVTVAIPETGSVQKAGPVTLNAASQPLLSGILPVVLGGVAVAAIAGVAGFMVWRSRRKPEQAL